MQTLIVSCQLVIVDSLFNGPPGVISQHLEEAFDHAELQIQATKCRVLARQKSRRGYKNAFYILELQ
jgi:hypothetical protein